MADLLSLDLCRDQRTWRSSTTTERSLPCRPHLRRRRCIPARSLPKSTSGRWTTPSTGSQSRSACRLAGSTRSCTATAHQRGHRLASRSLLRHLRALLDQSSKPLRHRNRTRQGWVRYLTRSPTTSSASHVARPGSATFRSRAMLGMSVGLREGFVSEDERGVLTTMPTTLAAWAGEHLAPALLRTVTNRSGR